MNNIKTLSPSQTFCIPSISFPRYPSISRPVLAAINESQKITTNFGSMSGLFFQYLENNPTITGLALITLSILAAKALQASYSNANDISTCKHLSLESQLPQTKLDIHQVVNFADYRYPNEGNITEYRSLFQMQQPGLLVSTGTERSFFALIETVLASPQGYCKGLVIRDINPKVKAYTDFNVLLLRLSSDITEYKMLSDNCSLENQNLSQNKIEFIKSKLELDSSISSEVKQYYLENLDILAKSYYEINSDWRDPAQSAIEGFPRYFEDLDYFAILQRYAKSGNIISTVGDIGDLEFLSTKNISIVNVSNISDYTLIYFQSKNSKFKPKIISTELNYISINKKNLNTLSKKKKAPTTYTASQYKPISENQKQELDEILKLLETCQKNGKYNPGHHSLAQFPRSISLQIKNSTQAKIPFPYYSEELLTELKKLIAAVLQGKEPSNSSFASAFRLANLNATQKKEYENLLKRLKDNPAS